MQNTDIHTFLTEWAEELGLALSDSNSFGIALFVDDGKLLFVNAAISSLCADFNSTSLLHPTFEKLVSFEISDSLIFSGYLTIGKYNNVNTSIEAKVYRKANRILITGGINVSDLIEQNKTMHSLNLKVTNLQRQLTQEKAELERTMKELKETQQMLIHSEKMNAMGKLVAGVAHELNNPISFVYSNIFSLEKYIAGVYKSYLQVENLVRKNGNEELVDEVAKIRKKNELEFLMDDIADMAKESKVGIERIKTIVEDLRRFSRLDESEIKQIDLIENIRSTLSIVRAEINKKNIDFKFVGPDTLTIECYPGQLNQAILNVLINAFQAVGEGGKVSLVVSKDVGNIIIAVKDNGCGIPNDIKQKIFDPFFTTKPVGSGTGLGLSITYKIINDLHKGSIQVESESNKETIFTIAIPDKISTNENR
jgi:two-component system, NtrC family, sensor kinase